MFVCASVCVCVARERERGAERESGKTQQEKENLAVSKVNKASTKLSILHNYCRLVKY